MEMWTALVGIGAAGLLAATWVCLRYRRDLRAAHERVAEGSRRIETRCGRIEYGEAGRGAPVLLIHGAGGGYDQGLILGGLLVGEAYRLIAPSRFGYLGSAVPDDSSPEAQADAFACLLDALGVDRVGVVGVSAGGPSALAFAQRYPERTAAMVLVAAVSYVEPAAAGDRGREARINRLVGSDLLHWTIIHAARSSLLCLLGVSREVQKGLTPTQMAPANRLLESMLPVSRRLQGVLLDQRRHLSPDLRLAQIKAPTLVVHARDDSLVDWSHGTHAAESIEGAELMTLERGGHLLLGQIEPIRIRVTAFLQEVAGLAPSGPQDRKTWEG